MATETPAETLGPEEPPQKGSPLGMIVVLAVIVGIVMFVLWKTDVIFSDHKETPTFGSSPEQVLLANRPRIFQHGYVRLTWGAADAKNCWAKAYPPNKQWDGKHWPTHDSRLIVGLTTTSRFQLACSNKVGESVSNVVVRVNPRPLEASLYLKHKIVKRGALVLMVWYVHQAEDSSLTSQPVCFGYTRPLTTWQGQMPAGGYQIIGPILVPTTFYLDCADGRHTVLATAKVLVRG